MGYVLKGLVILLALMTAAVAALVINPPAGIVARKVAQEAGEAFGGHVEIRGRKSLHIFPAVVMRLEDVTFARDPADGAPVLSAAAIEVEPYVLSLLWRDLRIKALRLEKPVASIKVDESGIVALPGLGPAGAEAPGGGDARWLPHIAEMTVSDGTVRVEDARNRQQRTVSAIEGRVVQAAANAPHSGQFSFDWAGERVEAQVQLGALATLVSGSASPASFSLRARQGDVDFNGEVQAGGGLRLAGAARAQTPSVPGLAMWLAPDVALPDSLETASFQGRILIASGRPAVEAADAPREGPQATAPGDAWHIGFSSAKLSATGALFAGLGGAQESTPGRLDIDWLSASLARPGKAAPVSGKLEVDWNRERVSARATAEQPESLLEGQGSAVALTLSAPRGEVEAKGTLLANGMAPFEGEITAETESLRGLASWAGWPLPEGGGLERTSMAGAVRASWGGLDFTSMRLAVDDTKAEGNFSLRLDGPRPLLSANLSADRIVAARYVPTLANEASAEGRETVRGPGAPAVSVALIPFEEALMRHLDALSAQRSRAREALAESPAPVIETQAPAASQSAWSAAPIELNFLRRVDLDLQLAVESLEVGRRTMRVPDLKSVLGKGRLVLEARELATHGGSVNGSAVIDVQSDVPVMRAEMAARDFDASALFEDLGIKPVLAGKSRLQADVSASGRSERDLVGSLSGRIVADAGSGSIIGWDVRRDWGRMLSTRKLGPYDARARTPYDRVSADVTLEAGEATSSTFQLDGPVIGVMGQGRANLVTRQIDYRARLAAAIPPPLRIPFRMTGPWSSPAVGLDPDAGGLLSVIGSFFGFGEALPEGAAPPLDPKLADAIRRTLAETDDGRTLEPAAASALRALLQQGQDAR